MPPERNWNYWNYSYSQIGDYNVMYVKPILHTEEKIKLERLEHAIWIIETWYAKN